MMSTWNRICAVASGADLGAKAGVELVVTDRFEGGFGDVEGESVVLVGCEHVVDHLLDVFGVAIDGDRGEVDVSGGAPDIEDCEKDPAFEDEALVVW